MFKWLNKQGVASTTGFVLQSMHRFFYHYIEEGRTMQITVEPLTDQHGHYLEMIDSTSLQQWLPPDADVIIADTDRTRIRTNVSAALTFMDIDHRFT